MRIGQPGIGCAVGERAAVIEHVDAVGQIRNHLHVVLGPDDGHFRFVFDAQDKAREVLPLFAVKTGGRLAQERHRRLERQGTGEADDLLNAKRQCANWRMTITLQFDQVDDALDGGAVEYGYGRPPRALAELVNRGQAVSRS